MNKLESFNQKLKAAKLGTRIEVRGDRLSIVATFPPKPGSTRPGRHQQRLALHTLANSDGLSHAYRIAQLIGGQLATGNFNWAEWFDAPSRQPITCQDWIETARTKYLNDGGKPETWRNEYQQPFKRLPQGDALSTDLLLTLLFKTQPNTRTRRRYALAFAYLCDTAGIENNFREKTGNYSPNSVTPRLIPQDNKILLYYHHLTPYPQWQWAYGVMACYGLRNHEIMFCDLDNFPLCYIFRGKSRKERYAYPLFPEWAEDWKLFNLNRPDISGKVHGDLGHRVSQAFRRYGVPFTPYCLRHARARRGVEFGEDPSFTAIQMGHSLQVHLRIYRPWLSLDTTNKAYQDILSNPDRPKPPTI
jgi:integrase